MTRTMYTMENLEGTYEDLAMWFTDILQNKKDVKEVTKEDIVEFLVKKDRVPKNLVKKIAKKVPVEKRVGCIGLIFAKDEVRPCKNKASVGCKLCALHLVRPPKATTEDSETVVEGKKKPEKKQQKKTMTYKELRELDFETLENHMDVYISKDKKLVKEVKDIAKCDETKGEKVKMVRALKVKEAMEIYKLAVVLGEKEQVESEEEEGSGEEEVVDWDI